MNQVISIVLAVIVAFAIGFTALFVASDSYDSFGNSTDDIASGGCSYQIEQVCSQEVPDLSQLDDTCLQQAPCAQNEEGDPVEDRPPSGASAD